MPVPVEGFYCAQAHFAIGSIGPSSQGQAAVGPGQSRGGADLRLPVTGTVAPSPSPPYASATLKRNKTASVRATSVEAWFQVWSCFMIGMLL